MKSALLLLCVCFGFFCEGTTAFADDWKAGDIVDGPYAVSFIAEGEIYVESTNDQLYPLSVKLKHRSETGERIITEIDRYDVAGVNPEIESIFFYPVRGRKNILILVSWAINARTIGTYGTMYSLYGYEQDDSGKIRKNEIITSDIYLGGMDGFQEGEASSFPYKTAALIKNYLRKNYK